MLVKVSITPLEKKALNGRVVALKTKYATTDATGYFSASVYQGLRVRIECKEAGYRREITLATSTQDWKDIAE